MAQLLISFLRNLWVPPCCILSHLLLLLHVSFYGSAQPVSIVVEAEYNHVQISPWIYGRNNSLSDNPSNPLTPAQWQILRDAGLRFFRENRGNNATKYHWQQKLSSHPDWYNNVYLHDWDFSAQSLLTNTTGTQGMYALQLLEKAANSTGFNFDEVSFNGGAWWSGVTNNWAGGGGPPAGEGNATLYLTDWSIENSADILDYWRNSLGYDMSRLKYWNMDNEPELWFDTHDDVGYAPTAEEFMQRYFRAAKAARAKFPGVKIVGPVTSNEWFWYNWDGDKVVDPVDGQKYPWIEYFIKRVAEEQRATGVRLLDVLDVHFYPPGDIGEDNVLQLHRIWFDDSWDYPRANGVKVVGPLDWNPGVKSEYFFKRCYDWLNIYMGLDHGVTFGLSECGDIYEQGTEDPNVVACWYASHLGVFAQYGVELFAPWFWYIGQWEILHLFSNHYGKIATQTSSSDEAAVSAYSSLSSDGDSLTIVLVNRDRASSRSVDVEIRGFTPSASSVNGYLLDNLPANETFVSKVVNHLQSATYSISAGHLVTNLPSLSVSLIKIPTSSPVLISMDYPLPLDAITLSGRRDGANVVLEWSTDLELGGGHFLVEKSYNGIDYSEVGTVMGASSTTLDGHYSFTDFEVSGSRAYYRVALVYPESREYSSVVVIRETNERSRRWQVFPNPSDSFVQLVSTVDAGAEAYLELVLRDGVGRFVSAFSGASVLQVTERLNVELAGIPAGVYHLDVNDGHNSETLRLIRL